jgi:DNA-binding SARP family transcriptional activator
VEALLGFTVIHGLEGRADDAESAAREALAIVEDAGDRYIRGVTSLTLGAALVLCNHPRAEEWLHQAVRLATACGDVFTPCVADLWLAVHLSRTSRAALARENFARVLRVSREHGYEFLFQGTPLLAPKDISLVRGLLRRAQEHAEVGEYARALTRQLDPASETASATSAESLATAPLYIQTLGPFRAWRKGQEIERAAWGREKALHLLQLLVCNRGRGIHREQVLESLWADSSSSTAATGLRVALNALRHALSPDRESGTEDPFVRRDGETLRLGMEAGIRVDADEFTRLLKAARAAEHVDDEGAIALYESALALYRGEFLAENRYAEWAEAERQQKRSEFLTSAERLGNLLLKAGDGERASRWAETMLQHDPLWEAAYAILMEAYWRQGNRALAVRAYNRCRKRLQESLGVEPSRRTAALMQTISELSS